MSQVYAPHAVVDLENDGTVEIIAGKSGQIMVYEYKNGIFIMFLFFIFVGALHNKGGFPVDACTSGESCEVRGMAVG